MKMYHPHLLPCAFNPPPPPPNHHHHPTTTTLVPPHMSVNRFSVGSDNGLAPNRRQAITWINADSLLIEPFGTNFSDLWIGIITFSFTKMLVKMLSATKRPFCPRGDALKHILVKNVFMDVCIWWNNDILHSNICGHNLCSISSNTWKHGDDNDNINILILILPSRLYSP